MNVTNMVVKINWETDGEKGLIGRFTEGKRLPEVVLFLDVPEDGEYDYAKHLSNEFDFLVKDLDIDYATEYENEYLTKIVDFIMVGDTEYY